MGRRWALEFFENTSAVKSHLLKADKEVEGRTTVAQQGISGLMSGKNLEDSQKLDQLEKQVQIQTIAEKVTPASGDEVSGSFGNGLETATKTLSQITLEQDCLSGPSPLEPKRCRKFVPKDRALVGKKARPSQDQTGRQAQANKQFTEVPHESVDVPTMGVKRSQDVHKFPEMPLLKKLHKGELQSQFSLDSSLAEIFF